MALGLIALCQAGREPNLADLGVGKSTSCTIWLLIASNLLLNHIFTAIVSTRSRPKLKTVHPCISLLVRLSAEYC